MKPRSLLCLALASFALADNLYAGNRREQGTVPADGQTITENLATNGAKPQKLRFVDEDGDGINDMVQGLPSIDDRGKSGNELRGTGPAYRLFFDSPEPRAGERGSGSTKSHGRK
jgi:hypothetical protein